MARWLANKRSPNDAPENSTSNLCTTLNDAIPLFVPCVTMENSNDSPNWFNKELKQIKNRRDRVFKKFKISGSLTALSQLGYPNFWQWPPSGGLTSYNEWYPRAKLKTKEFPPDLPFNGDGSAGPLVLANMFVKFSERTYSKSIFAQLGYYYSIQTYNIFSSIVLS